MLILGTLGLCCAAAPADAKDRAKSVSGPNPALSGIGRLAPARAVPMASAKPRISFTNDSVVRFDGTAADRRAIVGSVPLMGPIAAEFGLFSITGASPKDRELKRTDPLADVQPRRSKVAAVGLRMSF